MSPDLALATVRAMLAVLLGMLVLMSAFLWEPAAP